MKFKLFISVFLAILAFVQSFNDSVVNVSLYYESLDPASQKFINEQLTPAYQRLGKHVLLDLVPIAKRIYSDGKIHCYHGEEECYSNAVHACLIKMAGNQEKALKFIDCMNDKENNLVNEKKYVYLATEICAIRLGHNLKQLKTCANGEEGKSLILENEHKRANLKQRQEFVPWIVINGNHSEIMQEKAEQNLSKYICDQYFEGDKQMEQCKNVY